MSTDRRISDERFILAARDMYQQEGDIEIDDLPGKPGCMVSRNEGGDDGAYVQGWVWVPNEHARKQRPKNKKHRQVKHTK